MRRTVETATQTSHSALGVVMDKNSKWARANIPEAANLSDSELSNISRNAWNHYRFVYGAVFGIGVFVYIGFLGDPLVQAFLEKPSFWHYLLGAMIFGGLLGGMLAMIFQEFVRRRIRKSVTSE